MTRSYDSGPIFERNRVIDKVAVDFQSVRGFAQDLAYFWGSDGGLVAQFRGIVEAIDAIFEEIYQIRNAVYDSTPIARYFMGEAVNDVVERMEKVIDCEFEARYRKLQSGLWERFSAALQRFSIDVDVKDWGALSEDLGRVTEVCDWCGRVRAQMRHRTAAWEKKVQRVPEEVCDVVSEYMSACNYVAGVRTLRTGITELPQEMARIKAELKKARELEYVVLRRVSYDVLLQQAQAQEETKKQLIKERKAREEKQRELHEIIAEVVFACKNTRFADLHVAMETFVEDKELGDGRFQGTLQVNGKRKVVEVIRSPKTQELINRIKQLVLVSHPAILPVLGWSCDSTMFSFATAPMQTTLSSMQQNDVFAPSELQRLWTRSMRAIAYMAICHLATYCWTTISIPSLMSEMEGRRMRLLTSTHTASSSATYTSHLSPNSLKLTNPSSPAASLQTPLRDQDSTISRPTQDPSSSSAILVLSCDTPSAYSS